MENMFIQVDEVCVLDGILNGVATAQSPQIKISL